MCKMGRTRITNLKKRLEVQYETVIKEDVITQLSELSDNPNVVKELSNATPDEFNNVGLYIESLNGLRSDFFGYEVCDKVLDNYEKLPKLYKEALKNSLLSCVNESAVSATQSDNLTPFLLRYHIEKFDNWILESTKQQIKELVNDKFSKLDDLGDLNEAYKADYITSQQYCSRYEQITCGFSTCQFLKELSDYKINDSPIEIQWYVVSSIINQLGYESLDSYKYVKVEYLDSISDIRSLLKWLASYGHLNDVVLKKAEEKICSVLSKEEKWTLFEEKIIQSPGIENIRERLDNVYKNRLLYDIIVKKEKGLLKHSCFQDVMLSDLESASDPNLKPDLLNITDEEKENLIEENMNYVLTGILIHSGSSLQSGHYYSLIMDQESGKWYQFNDNVISEFNIEKDLEKECFGNKNSNNNGGEQFGRTAYLLFYTKKSLFRNEKIIKEIKINENILNEVNKENINYLHIKTFTSNLYQDFLTKFANTAFNILQDTNNKDNEKSINKMYRKYIEGYNR